MPPPNPATPAMVNPTVVAATTAAIFRTSSNLLLPKKSPGPSCTGMTGPNFRIYNMLLSLNQRHHRHRRTSEQQT